MGEIEHTRGCLPEAREEGSDLQTDVHLRRKCMGQPAQTDSSAVGSVTCISAQSSSSCPVAAEHV